MILIEKYSESDRRIDRIVIQCSVAQLERNYEILCAINQYSWKKTKQLAFELRDMTWVKRL